jgi:hypothetical protein
MKEREGGTRRSGGGVDAHEHTLTIKAERKTGEPDQAILVDLVGTAFWIDQVAVAVQGARAIARSRRESFD